MDFYVETVLDIWEVLMEFRIFACQCFECSVGGYDHSFCCGTSADTDGLGEAALGQEQWGTVLYSG